MKSTVENKINYLELPNTHFMYFSLQTIGLKLVIHV